MLGYLLFAGVLASAALISAGEVRHRLTDGGWEIQVPVEAANFLAFLRACLQMIAVHDYSPGALLR